MYLYLTPDVMVAWHAYVYRHMPEVGGIVYTHSAYLTAWAACREPIPCVLTAIADEFGGEIPVGPLALVGGPCSAAPDRRTARALPELLRPAMMS